MQALIWPGRGPASRPHCLQQSACANDRHNELYVVGEYVERLQGGKLSRSSRDQNPNFQALTDCCCNSREIAQTF
jgi:hypothetical protein